MIEIENWWLLAIPLFFVLGWVASRFEQRAVLRDKGRLPAAYSRGLNFLLNEQSDKAVDAFVDVVRIEPDAIETHFALGSLFRRRGETDRAIRVHQNLAERRDLPNEQRDHALFELGQDYLKAGLIDRAEDVFNRLEGTSYGPAALHLRLEIAQRVRDWQLAIDLAQRLSRDYRENHNDEIAHFHCELAQKFLAHRDSDHLASARRQLDAAIEIAPAHARAHLMRGSLAYGDGDSSAAIAAWRELIERSPAHIALVIDDWFSAHRAAGRTAEGIAQAKTLLDKHASSDILAALAEAIAQQDGEAAGQEWAQRQLRQTPSLLGLEKLLAIRARAAQAAAQSNQTGVSGGAEPAGRAVSVDRASQADRTRPADPATQAGPSEDGDLVQAMIQAQVRRLSRYVCGHCGFKARQFYWQCAGCNRWDTYAPKRSEELGA